MRKAFFIAAGLSLTLIVGGMIFAQDRKDPAPRAKGTLPAMWSKLGLTDEQKQQIYSVQADYRTKIDELRKQVRQLEKKERGDMDKLLTDAQRARLKELIAEKASGGVKTEAKPAVDKKP